MENIRCIAVDWSGNKRDYYQKRAIWSAEAECGRLMALQSGRTRLCVVNDLLERIRRYGPLVIGLDFAFSFPEWHLEREGIQNAPNLWAWAAAHEERWLKGNTWPFWGLPNTEYPRPPECLTLARQFRETDWVRGGQSVFRINGNGNVGTGTIRGLRHLVSMRRAGAAIWPFDAAAADGPVVVEIYPRVFYGDRVSTKRNEAGAESRRTYLGRVYPDLAEGWRDAMVRGGDAFDAGVSALVMSAHVGDLQRLRQATERPVSVEGEIWAPLIRRWFHE